MFEVTVEQTFAAGHALRDYKGGCENVHGHNYRVRVTVQGDQLDRAGLLVDFLDLNQLISGAVAYLDHRFINDLPPFDEMNPSAENMAKYFFDRLSTGLKNEVPVRISEVRVWETDTTSAVYRP
ncbi:MAG TPA: 6-carboxytetrahydropterin synthase QueD [Bryobacteraceae bacterium]|nr:6-carboxytetrahydropterin synthase QueD [Bryobacteraceae bacterium]